jgi:hypothetical protein
MNGFTKSGFLNTMHTIIIKRKRLPPHKNPNAALPITSDINHENEMTRNSKKNNNMKLVMKINSRMLNNFESTLMLVNLKISTLVSK